VEARDAELILLGRIEAGANDSAAGELPGLSPRLQREIRKRAGERAQLEAAAAEKGAFFFDHYCCAMDVLERIVGHELEREEAVSKYPLAFDDATRARHLLFFDDGLGGYGFVHWWKVPTDVLEAMDLTKEIVYLVWSEDQRHMTKVTKEAPDLLDFRPARHPPRPPRMIERALLRRHTHNRRRQSRRIRRPPGVRRGRARAPARPSDDPPPEPPGELAAALLWGAA
jgi:hypothetical protein